MRGAKGKGRGRGRQARVERGRQAGREKHLSCEGKLGNLLWRLTEAGDEGEALGRGEGSEAAGGQRIRWKESDGENLLC